jgi:hypothetical protein
MMHPPPVSVQLFFPEPLPTSVNLVCNLRNIRFFRGVCGPRNGRVGCEKGLDFWEQPEMVNFWFLVGYWFEKFRFFV